MRARDVEAYLRSLDGGWVDRGSTTDRFVAGDPEIEVSGIAVGWMSYSWALQRALELGCSLFITHEPTFFGARDDDEGMFRFEAVRAKRRFVEGSGMAILRCHDLWDQMPGIGIPDAWGRMLGLGEPVAGEGFYRMYDVSGHTAESLAREVAARTRGLGQEAVELVGPADCAVSRLVIGTGAITPLTRFLDAYSPDIAICTDDGFTYWHTGALAIDLGLPVIVVNHAVSEIAGMRCLAAHLLERFPQVPVHFIEQGCMYRLVGT